MIPSSFEQLEELVPNLLAQARQLREENRKLSQTIALHEKDLEDQAGQIEAMKKELDRLTHLETAQLKQEEERKELRNRVQGILDELENVDFL